MNTRHSPGVKEHSHLGEGRGAGRDKAWDLTFPSVLTETECPQQSQDLKMEKILIIGLSVEILNF